MHHRGEGLYRLVCFQYSSIKSLFSPLVHNILLVKFSRKRRNRTTQGYHSDKGITITCATVLFFISSGKWFKSASCSTVLGWSVGIEPALKTMWNTSGVSLLLRRERHWSYLFCTLLHWEGVSYCLKAMCHTDAPPWSAREIASIALPAEQERHTESGWHIALKRGETHVEHYGVRESELQWRSRRSKRDIPNVFHVALRRCVTPTLRLRW